MRSRTDRLQMFIVICCFIYALFMVGCGSDIRNPTAPTDVMIFNQTESSLSLVWNGSSDNVSVSGYEVIRNGIPYIETLFRGFIDSGLQPATLYCYQLRAFDAAGNASQFSPLVCGSTLSLISGTPLQVSGVGSITDSTFRGSDILNSTFINTTISSGVFIGSGIVNSVLEDCLILNATFINSPLFGNTISGRSFINTTIINSPGLW